MAKALVLNSGGLDSTLAARLLQEQNVEVEAVHFVSVFGCGASCSETSPAQGTAGRMGVKLHLVEISADLLDIVKNPKHGYGKNMNPCIDCHACMVRRAAELMKEIGADFLATGEVLGERPMSQRRESLRTVELDGGMEGLLLRPDLYSVP